MFDLISQPLLLLLANVEYEYFVGYFAYIPRLPEKDSIMCCIMWHAYKIEDIPIFGYKMRSTMRSLNAITESMIKNWLYILR